MPKENFIWVYDRGPGPSTISLTGSLRLGYRWRGDDITTDELRARVHESVSAQIPAIVETLMQDMFAGSNWEELPE